MSDSREKSCLNCRHGLVTLDKEPCLSCSKRNNWESTTTPRDAYDLAEMIIHKVKEGSWNTNAVADAIERLYEAREKAKP